MLRLTRKAQSTAEYAIVIGLVIAAAVAMQVYVKRSLQAKVKDAADYNDPGATMLTTSQYEPYYVTSDMTSKREADNNIETKTGGGVVRSIIGEEKSSNTGTQGISGVQ